MYEDYFQNYYNYPINEFQNTYEGMDDTYPYEYYQNRYTNDYNFMYPNFNYQTRGLTNNQIEELYPDVYKILYPIVKKVLNKNKARVITQDLIENMVEEVYSNIEEGGQIELNREVKKEVIEETKNENKDLENRGHRRNSNLLDVIKILLLRELIGRTACNRPDFRPNMPPPPPRPPFYTRPPFSA